MAGYRPLIAAPVAGRIRSLAPELKGAVRQAIRAIVADPRSGEPLERELEGYLKFRVRRYRIVYRVDATSRTVTIVALGHRHTIYEEAADRIRTDDPRERR